MEMVGYSIDLEDSTRFIAGSHYQLKHEMHLPMNLLP